MWRIFVILYPSTIISVLSCSIFPSLVSPSRSGRWHDWHLNVILSLMERSGMGPSSRWLKNLGWRPLSESHTRYTTWTGQYSKYDLLIYFLFVIHIAFLQADKLLSVQNECEVVLWNSYGQVLSTGLHWLCLKLHLASTKFRKFPSHLAYIETWNMNMNMKGYVSFFHFFCVFHIWTFEQNLPTLSTLSTVT